MTAPAGLLTEVTATIPMLREVNKGLMVAWINADLLNRCHHDVRSSIVLYGEGGDFLSAVDPSNEHLLADPSVARLLWNSGARTWSRGIV